jgi:hypothetical protein
MCRKTQFFYIKSRQKWKPLLLWKWQSERRRDSFWREFPHHGLDLVADFCEKFWTKKKEKKPDQDSPEASEDIENEKTQPQASEEHRYYGDVLCFSSQSVKPSMSSERKRHEGYHQWRQHT